MQIHKDINAKLIFCLTSAFSSRTFALVRLSSHPGIGVYCLRRMSAASVTHHGVEQHLPTRSACLVPLGGTDFMARERGNELEVPIVQHGALHVRILQSDDVMQMIDEVNQASRFPVEFHLQEIVNRLAVIVRPESVSVVLAIPLHFAVVSQFRQDYFYKVVLDLRSYVFLPYIPEKGSFSFHVRFTIGSTG